MGVALDYYPVHAHKYRCTSYVNIMIYNVYIIYIYVCTWVILFLYDFFYNTHTIIYTWLHAYISYVLTGRRAKQPLTFTHPLFKWSISGGINVHLQPGSHAVGRVDRHGVQVLSCPVGRVYWAPSACLGNLDSVKYHISCKGHPYQRRLEHLPGVCENDFTPTFVRVFSTF